MKRSRRWTLSKTLVIAHTNSCVMRLVRILTEDQSLMIKLESDWKLQSMKIRRELDRLSMLNQHRLLTIYILQSTYNPVDSIHMVLNILDVFRSRERL